jgi:vacuolar-type H+-ATPase subunit F/Vma7
MPKQGITVIGDEDAVFGLGLLGLKGRAVATVEQARKALHEAMADPNVELILLTENWSEARREGMGEGGALVVEIPGASPSRSALTLEARIEQALGVRLER